MDNGQEGSAQPEPSGLPYVPPQKRARRPRSASSSSSSSDSSSSSSSSSSSERKRPSHYSRLMGFGKLMVSRRQQWQTDSTVPTENVGPGGHSAVTILDVLGVDLCARAILDLVHVADLARSERVSRWWQRAVCHYLQTCRTLSYESIRLPYFVLNYPAFKSGHRAISMYKHNHSLPLVRKTLRKWGPYIVKVITHTREDTHFDMIVSECPNLEHIVIDKSHYDKQRSVPLTEIKKLKQLKQIVLKNFDRFSETKHSDLVLGELFQDISCENITIYRNEDLTGRFLKSLTSDSLKLLNLTGCSSLRVSDLLSGIDNIRNLTSLALDEGENKSSLNEVYLLLLEMPQLEELTLVINYLVTPLSEEWIQAFSRLGNLKRLTMRRTRGRVNNKFLEALARGCRKLEYLEIIGSAKSVTARGVRALCCRTPSARTTLHFPPRRVVQYFEYEEYFLYDFKHVPLYKELAALGCVELTREWFEAAYSDPCGRELSLNPTRGSRAEEPQKELKLIIFQ